MPYKIPVRAIFLVIVSSFLSCQSERAPSTWVKPDTTTIACDDYYSHKTKLGIFNNNVWNKHAAEKDTVSQEMDHETQYGWSWSWPEGRRVIYAYPQVKVGSSPWAPEPRFDDRFPLQLSTLKKLRVHHDLEIDAVGEYNVATTLWLTREAHQGNKPELSNIIAEVMIWTFATEGHFDPAGSQVGELIVEGKVWEVWTERDWSDPSGKNNNKWISLSFRVQDASLRFDIGVMELLQYALKEGLIPPNLLIADVELGNEVMEGSGLTWVKAFGITIEEKE